ncbi:tetratricopeptide repeat protein [bacterium]|nr:tetratricopeptide repeat protein [bacterium]
MGLCFDKLGKYTYAIRYYKKYISLKPMSQTAKSLVGRIYEIHKNKEKMPHKNSNLKIIAK